MKIIQYKDLNTDFYNYEAFSGTEAVSDIINDVKNNGDKAVREYSKKFGDGEPEKLELNEEEKEKAFSETPEDVKNCIREAIENIRAFAETQLSTLKEIETTINGVRLGQKLIPLEKAGAYVPGGNYPLPSSAVMSIIPAKIAGVQEVIACSPRIKPETITACVLAGADRIFRIGGVQAIAAMAYGTETVPAVNKIVGPGNKYVTAAKKEVYGKCGIDFLAGPSEVMIIADDTANPDFIAADLLAQLEHDIDARAYLITNSRELADKSLKSIEKFLKTLKTADIASVSLEKSFIILVDEISQAAEIADKKAPEHLEICYQNADKEINRYKNYGSLFIGLYSAEVFGDYCSGTNHILPTNGVARYSGGLSVFDFIKIQTYQEISPSSAQKKLSGLASRFAEIEGLYAHKLSADLRSETDA